jgi:hypothetical protein
MRLRYALLQDLSAPLKIGSGLPSDEMCYGFLWAGRTSRTFRCACFGMRTLKIQQVL